MVTRQELAISPEVTPIIGGVLEHAQITEGMNWQEPDTGLFESYNCLLTDRRASWPCPWEYLAPPVQTALATGAVGGTVPADTYFFTITALNAEGETLESNEQTIVTAGATSTVTAEWNLVPGATGYRIYATGGAAGSETLLDEVGAVDTYLWDGTPAIGVTQPPTANTARDRGLKTFDTASWPEAQRAVLYGGVECKRFDSDREAALKEISRVFASRESYGVERVLLETVLQGADDITPTPGTAVSAKLGLALLEAHAAGHYAGVPTLHLPRVIASLLAGDQVIEAQGGKLYTRLGSKVGAGGGYDVSNIGPDGTPADAGEMWLYGSGEVVVRRSDIKAKDAMELATNNNVDLVERAYLVAVDCYTSAVLVSVE